MCLSVQFVCMDASLQSASILGKIQSGNDVQSAEELRGARPDSLLMLGCKGLLSVSSGVHVSAPQGAQKVFLYPGVYKLECIFSR